VPDVEATENTEIAVATDYLEKVPVAANCLLSYSLIEIQDSGAQVAFNDPWLVVDEEGALSVDTNIPRNLTFIVKTIMDNGILNM